jgi:hypothetical protein
MCFWESLAVCEIMWKNIVDPGRPQMTIWRMRFACWIPKATNTLYVHCNNGCTNALWCCVPHTLPVVLSTEFFFCDALMSSEVTAKQIPFENENFGLFIIYAVTDDFVLDKVIPWLGPLDGIGFIFTENADVCLACRI